MWHVLHTAPRSEPQVCTFLAANGLRSYTPEFRSRRATRPGSVRDGRHQWIFPGYVFFQAHEGFTRWDVVRWAPGVRRILYEDGAPAVMDDVVVEHLRDRLATAQPPHPGAGFRPGQRVTVDGGPLAMVDAVFDRCLKAPDRVRVLVRLLGHLVTAEVDPRVLRPVG